MFEHNNLLYTSQNHSSITILKNFVCRWQMNITAEVSDLRPESVCAVQMTMYFHWTCININRKEAHA